MATFRVKLTTLEVKLITEKLLVKANDHVICHLTSNDLQMTGHLSFSHLRSFRSLAITVADRHLLQASNLDLMIFNMTGLSLWKKPINYISLNGCENRCREELARRLLKTLYNGIIMED